MIIDTDRILSDLRKRDAKKIMLMVPDGLKPSVFSLFQALSKEFSIIISSDPFFGACDVGEMALYNDVDVIVQLGHSEIPNIKYPKPVLFIEYREDRDLDLSKVQFTEIMEKGYSRIGLLFSIQYMKAAEQVRKMLEERGFQVIIGNNDGRLKYPGQVLGCNYSTGHSVSEYVDCFLLVSTGIFHALGAQLSLEKEVFLLDLNDLTLRSLKAETDRAIRIRYAAIARAMDAKKVCVVLDTKIGQRRRSLADTILRQADSAGLETVMIHSNNCSPTEFENMRCDLVVFTGCPRVPIDDQDKYPMPILTPQEFQIAFKFKKTNRYIMDEIVSVD